MFKFAWKNLITRPTRTALAVLGLTIPVVAFLGLFSVSRGIRHLMGDTLGKMQGLMVLRENAPAPVLSDLPAEMEEQLRKVPGVGVVAPEVWRVAPPIDGRGRGIAGAAMELLTRPRQPPLRSLLSTIAVEGIDIPGHMKLKSAVFPMSILPKDRGGGRFLNRSDMGKPHVVISTKIAREFPNADGTPKAVGQTIRLGNRDFTIIGIYNTGSIVLDATLVMDIGVARELLGVDSRTVSTFNVEPTRITDVDALLERIERMVPGVHAQRISQFNLTVGEIMGKLDLLLLLAVALAMLVGAVGIANTMLMSTSERYVEFGVMRTSGWTRRNVLALVTTESALLGLLSGLLGGSLAVGAVFAVNRFLNEFKLDLSPNLLAASIAAALAIATLSGLYPAWRASRMTPMDAIRHSTV